MYASATGRLGSQDESVDLRDDVFTVLALISLCFGAQMSMGLVLFIPSFAADVALGHMNLFLKSLSQFASVTFCSSLPRVKCV